DSAAGRGVGGGVEDDPGGLAAGVRGFPRGDVGLGARGEQYVSRDLAEGGLVPRYLAPVAVDPGIGVVRPIGSIDAGKDGLERVIFRLGDRVELVIVAAGAVDGGADEGGHH